MMFKEQADKCRKQANEFAGRPEAPFLLRVASAFDELATDSDLARHVRAASADVRPAAPRIHA
ncbi:MAG TPA: hypothetical protein VFR92_01960 [Sphingomicrobium sp.]|jgi:hypothetical protein|nr:hypothetical protein [Sphingomicrobium sp.]